MRIAERGDDMNERLIIRLLQDGQQLPVSSVTTDGVLMSSEEDNWPSGLVFEFDANNAGTRFQMDRVRKLNGWESFQFKLDCHVESGNLVFTGVRTNGFPSGSYWIRLRI